MTAIEIETERTLLHEEMSRTLDEFSKALEAKNKAVKAVVEFESRYGKDDA